MISCTWAITAEDAEPNGWIPTFSRVLRLELDDRTDPDNVALEVSLTIFRKFSPVLKSLRADSATLSCSSIFDLVHSFSLLEDLALVCGNLPEGNDNDLRGQQIVVPSVSGPLFTGSLEPSLGEFGHTTRRLPNLPSGLHSRKLAFMRINNEDFWWIMELVIRCSETSRMPRYYVLLTQYVRFWPCCGAIAYPHLQVTPARILSTS